MSCGAGWLLFASLSLSSPAATLLVQLTELDKQLTTHEESLRSLEKQRTTVQRELTDIETRLATIQVRHDEVAKQFKSRIRAMARMPTGARIAIIGGSESLADYLRVSRILRWVAKYDHDLQQQYSHTSKRLAETQSHFATEKNHLETIASAIRSKRDALAERQSERMTLVHHLVTQTTDRTFMVQAYSEATRQLQAAFGRLKPSLPQYREFSSNRYTLPWPVTGKVTTGFGEHADAISKTTTTSNGIAIGARNGTPVQAIAEGLVVFADWLDGYGQVVIIDHGNEYHTVSAHLSRIDVKEGEPVNRHAIVGLVGDTGSVHGTRLYFEIRHRGRARDPATWLRR